MKGKFLTVCAIHKIEECLSCGGMRTVNQWKERLEQGDYEWLIRDLASFPNDQMKAIQLEMIVAYAVELKTLLKPSETETCRCHCHYSCRGVVRDALQNELARCKCMQIYCEHCQGKTELDKKNCDCECHNSDSSEMCNTCLG